MNIIVHLLISNSVRKIVYDQIGARLNLTGFLFGSILPDLSKKYGEKPHFLKSSMGFVLDSTVQLNHNSDGSTQIGSYAYSRNVGVITHYLSDYFCYAHSEDYKDNIYSHYFYEFLMLFLFRRGLLLYFEKQKSEQPLYFSDLESFIQNSVQTYNNEARLRMHDIYFAIKVSAAVTINLLRKAMCDDGKKIFAANQMSQHDYYCLGDDFNESGIFL